MKMKLNVIEIEIMKIESIDESDNNESESIDVIIMKIESDNEN